MNNHAILFFISKDMSRQITRSTFLQEEIIAKYRKYINNIFNSTFLDNRTNLI